MNTLPDITFVRVEGIAMATAWAGNTVPAAPVVVWLHGLGGSSTMAFAEVANRPELAGWRSLLIDLPGHGHSDAPDTWDYEIEHVAGLVLETVRQLTGEPVILFGHSMGGSVAIGCAGRRPEAIRHLIVAEPNLGPETSIISGRIAAQSEGRFVSHGYPALLRTTRMQAERGDVESGDWLRTLELASPTALHRYSTSLQRHREPSFRQRLTGLKMPVSIIRGEHSPILDLPASGGLEGYVIPGAGHQMIAGNPGGFVEVLARVLSMS